MATEMDEIVTVTLDGVDLGSFDTASDGGASGGVVVTRQGGEGNLVTDKVRATPGDQTVSKKFDPSVDQEHLRFALSRAGQGDVVINRQPVDVNRNPLGRPITSKGTLDTVQQPAYDATSNTPTYWGMTCKITDVA